ncbi:hypothetical protein TSAR_006096 [Trichomalopsis sarcophagae]|uniref:Uncharacterized protein n=1 Tax=Trichomalopsis sarcophagae TaxID=543379 RepID=A0A232ELN4_9HYME|nr:hypothetical protein TSAR_006096 [Trichomalopsis sarcophagae]
MLRIPVKFSEMTFILFTMGNRRCRREICV